ncbi:MAG: helix-turn-helix domain-containing protein [Actinomycetaceae bacterium]|nr:helix-turn-helix domain-containing protein [Actinomycetaceae bacterium]
MPKVSAEHQQRQIDRIRSAAIRCFASNGFHATSMDAIIAEAGMSSSTVYSYFPGGKQEIILAVSAVHFVPVLSAVRQLVQADRLVGPEEAFRTIIVEGWLAPDSDGDAARPSRHARMTVNAWSEVARDLEMSRVYRERYLILKGEFTKLVQRWKDAGVIGLDLTAPELATLICDIIYGMVAEQIILGEVDYAVFFRLAKLLEA